MHLILPAVLTILIEGIFWSCFREFRNWRFLLWCGTVNLLTNVTLNISLSLLWQPSDTLFSGKVLICEILVVIIEFLLLGMLQGDKKLKLFLLTSAANIITYSSSFLF